MSIETQLKNIPENTSGALLTLHITCLKSKTILPDLDASVYYLCNFCYYNFGLKFLKIKLSIKFYKTK